MRERLVNVMYTKCEPNYIIYYKKKQNKCITYKKVLK